MDQIYVIIVAILFIFAIADLVVGVSNDAVNFLVSAVGSKAGKFGVIMIMATLGILIGSVFSNGMMEVARKGIFHPEMFFFEEIIFLFLAVMLTDIILLDFFNTFGFPTSSTVSLVFELLGAAVGISLMKVWGTGENIEDFINTSKALAIIGGILFSVVAAFLLGSIVQWLARIIFTFNIKKSYKKFGGLWAGLAFAIITFFMFVKGLKHSTMNDTYIVQWVLSHRALVILASFVFWTIISQFLIWFTKINVLKVVVLLGTFALAMAFAGNDLVNFIGVPLAGFSSFELWKDSGQLASEFSMEGLSGAVSVNPIFLFIAGAIMIVTLWTSKKAKSVISTSVDLSRQDSGYEKFGSSQLARALVRWAIGISETVKKIIPARTQVFLEKRFRIEEQTGSKKDIPAFDLIRASVNLVVASILISIATSYKLPLSTTYVTFMVTMGTSLSDRAWGRESAVFRVTGVISVITGWFFTAFIAFSMAFIVAILIFKGGAIVIGIIVAVDIFLISKSRIIHKKREKKEKEEKQKYLDEIEFIEKNLFEINTNKILAEIEKILNFLTDVHKAFVSVKRKKLKKALICSEEIKASSKQLKKNIFNTVQHLSDDNLNAAQYYVQVVDALREIANAVNFLAERYYEHIDNNHDVFAKKQLKELSVLHEKLYNYIEESKIIIENRKFVKINELRKTKNQLLRDIEQVKTKHLVVIHNKKIDLITSNLYLNVLAEYKNLALYFIRIVKAQKRFYISGKISEKKKEE